MTFTESTSYRVLLVEDSPTQRRYLATLINDSTLLQVVGEAQNGLEAISLAEELAPDVIAMDIRMPKMDGLLATERIMTDKPTPVVIVSGLLESEIDLSFRAVQAGAMAVVEKPPSRRDPGFKESTNHMLNTLVAMARVGILPHHRHENDYNRKQQPTPVRAKQLPELIVIGASTGGPRALYTILKDLPVEMPVPIVVAQHLPDQFIEGLVRWLKSATQLRVEIAEDKRHLQPGVVTLAPGTAHVTVERHGGHLVTRLHDDEAINGFRPSIDVLFRSVAAVCGEQAIGLVLSGMGDDGVDGLRAMRQAGARTFAQDETTSAVFGMPGAAIANDAVEAVLPVSQLAGELLAAIKAYQE
ncbi:MAG: chemotaxis-specific protein-glutamate methyltransferase CheB [Chloroflexi bacterium]|nr:MAG: chemotaxis response regulator protein-glutamate methylesterase [Phototrophicales bacterium]RMF77147.1 MAG: chemotaxis-specific protein-glutamate methyltransferase CheB [Chloroflexota bacterium]